MTVRLTLSLTLSLALTCARFEEAGGSEGAVRLYGPTRRATSVSTVAPIPQDGTAY